MNRQHPARRDVLLGLASAVSALALAPARAQSAIDLKPEFADVFHDARTEGVFAAQIKDRLVMTDEGRARLGYLPGSTFKIPNALIALETGVVADVDKEVIRWDGVVREIEELQPRPHSAYRHALFGGAGVPADCQPNRR